VGKYGRAGQATDDNITRRMRFAFCVTKTRIQTYPDNSEYLFLLTSLRNIL